MKAILGSTLCPETSRPKKDLQNNTQDPQQSNKSRKIPHFMRGGIPCSTEKQAQSLRTKNLKAECVYNGDAPIIMTCQKSFCTWSWTDMTFLSQNNLNMLTDPSSLGELKTVYLPVRTRLFNKNVVKSSSGTIAHKLMNTGHQIEGNYFCILTPYFGLQKQCSSSNWSLICSTAASAVVTDQGGKFNAQVYIKPLLPPCV